MKATIINTEKYEYEKVITSISSGRIVPVIGDHLSTLQFTPTQFAHYELPEEIVIKQSFLKERILVGLYQFICYQVYRLYQFKGEPSADWNLRHYASELLHEYDEDETELYQNIKEIYDSIPHVIRYLDPFEKLAEMGFQSLVTVNFDNFIEAGLKAQSRSFTQINNHLIQEENQETPTTQKNSMKLFNLIGSVETSKFILTDEKFLETFYQIEEKKTTSPILKEFFKAMKNKQLWLIGCGYQDWLMRFFIRSISAQSFQKKMHFNVVDESSHNDPNLSSFLSIFGNKVIGSGTNQSYDNTLRFVNHLYSSWKKRNGTKGLVPPVLNDPCAKIYDDFKNKGKEPLEALISFQHQNALAAGKVREALIKRGHQPMDAENTASGKEVGPQIKEYLKLCQLFVPIISEEALANTATANPQQAEWEYAIVRWRYEHDYLATPQMRLLPLIIDDTPPDDPRIPEAFQRANPIKVNPQHPCLLFNHLAPNSDI